MGDLKVGVTLPDGPNYEAFLALPDLLYPENHPGRQFKNSILNDHLITLLVAKRNDEVAGRCSLYFPPGMLVNGAPAACVGHYECIDHPEIAQKLLNEASQLARSGGKAYLVGPMNGSTWNHYRFSDHNDSPNFFLEPYHHLYYHEQFRSVGFENLDTYSSSLVEDMRFDHQRADELEAQFKSQGIRFRTFNQKQVTEELERIWHLISLAFVDNYLFTPITKAGFLEKYLPLMDYLNPAYIHLAEDASGRVVGLNFCMLDHWHIDQSRLIAKTVARHPDPQFAGMGTVLGKLIYQQAAQDGITSFIHAFIREGNASGHLSNSLSGKTYKTYTLYKKAL